MLRAIPGAIGMVAGAVGRGGGRRYVILWRPKAGRPPSRRRAGRPDPGGALGEPEGDSHQRLQGEQERAEAPSWRPMMGRRPRRASRLRIQRRSQARPRQTILASRRRTRVRGCGRRTPRDRAGCPRVGHGTRQRCRRRWDGPDRLRPREGLQTEPSGPQRRPKTRSRERQETQEPPTRRSVTGEPRRRGVGGAARGQPRSEARRP